MDANDRLLNLLERLIKQGNQHQFNLLFHKYHEADIAEALGGLPVERKISFFSRILTDKTVDIFEEMDVESQMAIIQKFKVENAAQLIEKMDKDDGVDLLEALLDQDEPKAQDILSKMDVQDQIELNRLLNYPEGSAGALMTTAFVSIPERLTVQDALSMYRTLAPIEHDASFHLFIVNQHQQIQGVISLRKLLLANPDKRIKDIRNNNPITVHVNTDQEDVARVFQKYRSIILPVVDDLGIVLGVITIDDVVDVVVEEASEDMLKLSGASGDIHSNKLLDGPIGYALGHRLPWLFVTIIGGMAASFIMLFYSERLSAGQMALPFILSFVPLLMGLGGNVGNQSATIVVRALAMGQLASSIKTIGREVALGGLIGATIGGVVGGAVFLMAHSFAMALCIGVAIFLNMTVATCLGSALPVVLNQFNIDPAVASAPFISTALDVIGQVIYFSLALVIFNLLLW